MISSDLPLPHDHLMVAVSIMISIIAAYAARALSEGGGDHWGRAWLVGGATANGIGTWSMHYTAMLALRMPIPVMYHWPTVLLSLLVGIVGAAAALLTLDRGKTGWPRLLTASVLMGAVGVSGLHFTAMAAMRVQARYHYSPALVILSVVLAIVFSWIALALMYRFRDNTSHSILRIHGSSLARGAANPAMHYTAMAAVGLTISSEVPDWSHAISISSLGISWISVVPAMVLVVTMLTSAVYRLRTQRARLDELFEKGPEAVVLMTADTRVLRVNGEFTRLFGYSPQMAAGCTLSDLIVPKEWQQHHREFTSAVLRGRRVVAEGFRRRKDDSRLYVSIVGVPVSLPGGEAEVYAIYRDITEQRAEEEQTRAATEKLRALSASLRSAKEEEDTRIARELHDELGSALTGLKWGLEELDKALAEPGARPRAQVRNLLKLADSTVTAVKRIASELRPSILDDLGLIEAIEWQAQQFQARTGLVCTCKSAIEDAHLSPEQSTAVFRILQEALTNVLRHAQATRVEINIEEDGGVFTLAICDNGRGLGEEVKWAQSSLGLWGMQERAQILGGNIQITGSEGAGTIVSVRMPISI